MSCSTAPSTGSDTASDVEAPSPTPMPAVPQTTLMIRNVPVLYSAEMLLAEWPNEGTYDFFYLPWNMETRRNLSYAFLNFTSETAALSFVQRWQKQRLPQYNSRKPLNISFADVQGLAENLRQLQRKRENLEQCHAMVFQNQRRVLLKEAVRTALLQAPPKNATATKPSQTPAKKNAAAKPQPPARAKKTAPGPETRFGTHCVHVGQVFSF